MWRLSSTLPPPKAGAADRAELGDGVMGMGDDGVARTERCGSPIFMQIKVGRSTAGGWTEIGHGMPLEVPQGSVGGEGWRTWKGKGR